MFLIRSRILPTTSSIINEVCKPFEVSTSRGMVTRYGHCEKVLKKKGDRVQRGEVIALVGNTGRSTGPHLHYEIRVNGVPVNPLKYILD